MYKKYYNTFHAYKENNRELLAEKSRNYYKENRDKILKKQKEYYQTHKKPYSAYKDKLKEWRQTLKGRFSQAKSRIKEKWNLTFEEYEIIIKDNKCHYCGKELNKSGSALDKKDPNGIYEINNVVPCCKNCNIMKNNFLSYEEMMVVGKALKKYWIKIKKINLCDTSKAEQLVAPHRENTSM